MSVLDEGGLVCQAESNGRGSTKLTGAGDRGTWKSGRRESQRDQEVEEECK